MNYQTFKQAVTQLQISIKDFDNTWHRWWMANEKYFASVLDAEKFLAGQKSNLTDTWNQAIVYFKIWTTYGVEVPHNDFASFLINSAACQTWISQNT